VEVFDLIEEDWRVFDLIDFDLIEDDLNNSDNDINDLKLLKDSAKIQRTTSIRTSMS
jgi:hypothetical protein